ncbi:mitochondrial pyruvate carrier 2 [Marchantia polymorpha subsp. ruderalis]|uniref:Mitochondrial pyruvate carrier n=1 Tax=Marchantia polymorpha TaxID=3197 RepID=A0A2R6XBF8_MARPO|nr:hypothetical protein MARPO_0025s0130 [Marchantia polymorpha]PTQ43451.1 hypothetical protein MARPO_0025s0130 [Marchantia polymorpha]BBN03683.1 hypothetical protein Mp_2g25480 [Marchantia polymorpha subsp. ruderalis]BBN03684.1 hypothetical protein Mp_2g25480 [Marchantia polymorpha subsp. ruderalis]|eukprot:PTQ43450.1 hypothetical protein MARPO_0025s0130 [Marchantia polymorpha]
MASKLASFWNHPAGPKTIFFWAPAMKWGISFINILDFQKPPEMISFNQQAALTTSAVIWCRYSVVIVPKNYNLAAVNMLMAATGIYQMQRKIRHDNAMSEGPKIKR